MDDLTGPVDKEKAFSGKWTVGEVERLGSLLIKHRPRGPKDNPTWTKITEEYNMMPENKARKRMCGQLLGRANQSRKLDSFHDKITQAENNLDKLQSAFHKVPSGDQKAAKAAKRKVVSAQKKLMDARGMYTAQRRILEVLAAGPNDTISVDSIVDTTSSLKGLRPIKRPFADDPLGDPFAKRPKLPDGSTEPPAWVRSLLPFMMSYLPLAGQQVQSNQTNLEQKIRSAKALYEVGGMSKEEFESKMLEYKEML
mmetsp:Transcript_31384/g.76566  ORF Transcript_31384/g.76566 Transcript_31384/m.76566 type:complete len:254 (-) Transcript_31384:205-966(-)